MLAATNEKARVACDDLGPETTTTNLEIVAETSAVRKLLATTKAIAARHGVEVHELSTGELIITPHNRSTTFRVVPGLHAARELLRRMGCAL